MKTLEQILSLMQMDKTESFVGYICEKFEVEGKKKTRNQHYQMRERFREGKIPTKGTSNSYFYNAALLCNTKNIPKGKAIELILEVFDKWRKSDTYSGHQ